MRGCADVCLCKYDTVGLEGRSTIYLCIMSWPDRCSLLAVGDDELAMAGRR